MNILILSDFVGIGDVAMATARAILTRMGHTALCLPTALISGTWNLGTPAVLDTTDYLKAALASWEQLGIRFQGVVIGYLSNEAQAAWIAEQCRRWKAAGIPVFLDPVFADGGKLYRGIPMSRVALLRGLLPDIDYLLPNATEAAFLTGEADAVSAAKGLARLGVGCAVVTGAGDAVVLSDGTLLPYAPVPGSYSGAGDAFTACFAGSVLTGCTPAESARRAIAAVSVWINAYRQNRETITGLPVDRFFDNTF